MNDPLSIRKGRRFLRRLGTNQSGNATLLMALGMPMLIGGAGLSVDFAQVYMWQREMQFATDQAAIAAAWDLAKNKSSDKYTTRAILEFEQNESVTRNFNTTPTVQIVDYGGGTANSVLVKASATKKLPFSSFFTQSATTVVTVSQASFEKRAPVTSCLVAVDPEEYGAVTFAGDAVFTAECGVASLSKNADSIVASGNPTVDAGAIYAAGGVQQWFYDNTDDYIEENVDYLVDPFEGLAPPEEVFPNNVVRGTPVCSTRGNTNKKTTAELLPGIYTDFKLSCDTTLAPGVYTIDGGGIEVASQYTLTGNGVIFVLKNGASMKINGGSAINLTGISYSYLANNLGYSADYAKRVEGMIVFEDRNSPGSTDSRLNGNNSTTLNGKIYLPVSNLEVSGTAQVANRCLHIVAKTIKLTGTTNLTDFCPPGYEITDAVSTGQGYVRLVA